MKLEIPLLEIQEYLSKRYNLKVGLKNTVDNKIEIDYYTTLELTIKEIKDEQVIFHYEANALIKIFANLAHSFINKKLANIHLIWNSDSKEIIIDLKKIKELRKLLKYLYISELHFINGTILLISRFKDNLQDHINE